MKSKTLYLSLLLFAIVVVALGAYRFANPGPPLPTKFPTLANSFGNTDEFSLVEESITLDNYNRMGVIARLQEFSELFVFSPDEFTLAVARWNGTDIWDASKGRRVLFLQHVSQLSPSPNIDIVRQLAFSPDGSLLASGSNVEAQITDRGSLKLWNVDSGELIRIVEQDTGIYYITFSPDGQLLAYTSNKYSVDNGITSAVRVVAVSDNTEIISFPDHGVSAPRFSPTGDLLAYSTGNAIKVWEVGTNRTHILVDKYNRTTGGVEFSPNGTLMVSWGTNGIIIIWDTATGTERGILRGHKDTIGDIAFSPNGEILASSSYDNTVRLWNIQELSEIHVLRGHTDFARCVAFSPDGTLLASGSWDSTVRLWEVSSGRALISLPTAGVVNRIAFGLDGKLLAADPIQGTQLWGVLPKNS